MLLLNDTIIPSQKKKISAFIFVRRIIRIQNIAIETFVNNMENVCKIMIAYHVQLEKYAAIPNWSIHHLKTPSRNSATTISN